MGLTKQLMKQQVKTPTGRLRWNQATVHGILANPVYTGTVFIGRYRTSVASQRQSALVPIGSGHGGHPLTAPDEWVAVAQVPVIVSQQQFDLVQAKLAHNQQFASRNNTAHPYLLRALVSCGLVICLAGSQQRGRLCLLHLSRQEPCHYLVSRREVFLPHHSRSTAG